MPVEIIAEVGVNHNGNTSLALEMLDAAAAAGADVVKFQTFDADSGVARDAPKAAYQRITTDPDESQFDMLKRLELPRDAYSRLVERCRELGVQFMSTPFDLKSLDFLVGEVRVTRLKIASGEVTNGPLLVAAGHAGLPILLSTGMSTVDEVRAALGAIAFGLLGETGRPSLRRFAEAFASHTGQAALREKVTVLHCVTSYPAPLDQANVRAVTTLREAFGLPVGYSDHTQGMAAALAAVALGAEVIEKHFTTDTTLPGPDQTSSMEPDAFAAMVELIRGVEASLGDGTKDPNATEREIMKIARRSLTAVADIADGDTLSEATLGVQRPGTGISPMDYWELLGTRATRPYRSGQMIARGRV